MNKRRVRRRTSRSQHDNSQTKVIASQSKIGLFGQQHGLKIFLVIIAIFGFFNAFRYGAASLDYYSVRNLVEQWQLSGNVTNQDTYLDAKSAIDTARILHKANPLYMDLSGQVTEWGVVSGFESNDGLLQAKDQYIAATKKRPLWPVTWANLAMIKWRLQEFDEEMLAYLIKADNLGKQSPEVHLLFSRIGISLYKSNHPMYTELRNSIQKRIVLGLRSSLLREELITFIDASEAREDVCRWLMPSSPNTARKHLACK